MKELGLCMYLCGLFDGFKGKLTENTLRDVFAKDFYSRCKPLCLSQVTLKE